MIAETNNQERLGREFSLEAIQQRRIVLRAERLPADVLVYVGRIAQTAPVWRELWPERRIPREMIGCGVDEQKQRAAPAFAGDDVGRLVKVKAVALESTGLHIFHVEIALDARGCLKTARAQKCSVERIKAEGFVATPAQRIRQTAHHATRCDACH